MLYKTGGADNFIDCISTIGLNTSAISLFREQYHHNSLYRTFSDSLQLTPDNVKTVTEIPFLPISFFKTHRVLSGVDYLPQLIFESSGTTGMVNSKHYVANEELYRKNLVSAFKQFYGDPSSYSILALLPSYIERNSSSLVYMAKELMKLSQHPENGFYLDEFEKLASILKSLEAKQQKTILLGVTFALLDFAEAYPMQLEHTIVMETGGMKGRREEMTREEVHDYLQQRWFLNSIHSEYGMTELLSQAYSKGNGLFYPSSTMKVLVRDINDPLDVRESGTGCLNIIDLANMYSCAFIATDDIGTVHPDGSFKVLGRADHSALRGCNLMVV